MNRKKRVLIVVAVLIFALGIVVLKVAKSSENAEAATSCDNHSSLVNTRVANPNFEKLPLMLELGSTTCVPCEMMEKVLDSLREKYSGQLDVEFLDVTVNRDAGLKYKIQLIPTQIFFDADGKEIFRHEGFFPEKDIVAKWREFSVDLQDVEHSTPALEVYYDAETESAGWLPGLFANLAKALKENAVVAFFAAFLWGVLSILLSPCHLSSIPLIVGFINDQHPMTTKRALALSTLFAVGILVTIAIVGFATAATGHMLGDLGAWTSYFLALVFILIGLHLFDVIPMRWSGSGQLKMEKKGLLAALILGLVFGIALGPCTFAYMAPMLAIVFKQSSERMFHGIMLLLFYGIGHCAVIVFAGTFTEWVQRYLNWNEESKGVGYLKKICATLVVIAGFYLIYIA